MLRKFLESRSGNFAILSGVTMIPLCLAAGLAVDYSRHQSAQRHLQEMADATSLALAASKEQNQARLEQIANDYLAANRTSSRVQQVSLANIVATTESVDVELAGSIPTTFMGIAGYQQLDIGASALAERATRGTVEVSLVLDNTWSMSDRDAKGVRKIDALKTAASGLVDQLLKSPDGGVRIALVPYGEYVNVGLQHRNNSWLDVPADYSVPKGRDRQCTTSTTKSRCVQQKAAKTCTREVDGVRETYSCGGGCAKSETYTVPEYQTCSGGKWTQTFAWHGCVGSRTGGTYRLNDDNASVKYPGYVTQNAECLNPLVRLTSTKQTLKDAITGMIIEKGSHKAKTYIPGGMIWGLHTLAPSGPFGDGLAYDEENLRPRKVVVLMTDGENTLLYDKNNGKAVIPSKNLKDLLPGERQAWREDDDDDDDCDDDEDESCGASSDPLGRGPFRQTNEDTLAICTNMKGNEVEIYTVAFMVDDPVARDMLKACASSSQHYFQASDAAVLAAAFSGIAQSLQVVRLAR
jgi:Flp pilus assembly protein TadG